MASKKRGGLSKREYKAKLAGTSVDYGAKQASKASKAGKAPSFKFDATKPTAEYTKLAAGIFDPQIQALQSQQVYNQQLAEKQKVSTRKQFADLLASTIESINQRGAFFGGGAVNQENTINTDQTDALTGIDTATTQANLGISSQIGELAGKKAEYISSGVNTAQSSAYNQFQDSLTAYFRQIDAKASAAAAAQDQANKDREYALALSKANKESAAKPDTYYVGADGKPVKLDIPRGARVIGGTSLVGQEQQAP